MTSEGQKEVIREVSGAPRTRRFPSSLDLHNPWLLFQVQLIYSLSCLLPSPAPEDKGRVCPFG